MSEQQNPNEITDIDIAREAISNLVENVIFPGEGRVMTGAVVFFETSRIDDDGDIQYEVSYSVVTDSSMSSAVGMVTLGTDVLMDACTSRRGDDD